MCMIPMSHWYYSVVVVVLELTNYQAEACQHEYDGNMVCNDPSVLSVCIFTLFVPAYP